MKWSIYILSATIVCFIVLLLAVLFTILHYRKKVRKYYPAVKKQRINFKTCVGGEKKPYFERMVQYLLGYNEMTDDGEDDGHDDDADDSSACSGVESNRGFVKLVAVQPSSESEIDDLRSRRQSLQNDIEIPEIDTEMYRNRSYTDSPSPEGKKGIWRARESLFYKYGRNRRRSELGSSDDKDVTTDGRISPLVISEFQERGQLLKRSPIPDRRSKILFDEATKVTGKPPLSPNIVRSLPTTPKQQPQQHFNFNARRNSAAMVLDKTQNVTFTDHSGSSSVNGSIENLTMDLGNLEISLYYSNEENLLKVCVLDVICPEERSLVDVYIKVAFYLFEKPYKNEMQLWSDSTKSLVRRTFSYLVKNVADLQRAVLKFTLKRKNTLVRSKILGRSILKLCGVKFLEAQAYTLKLQHSIPVLLGEILVSVCHQATTGILRVGLVRAMGLAKTMRRTMGAPFAIIELKSQDNVVFVKNTKQKSNKINPLFQEYFEIPVTTDSKIPLDEFQLRITVFRYTFSGSNDVVGFICLGTGSAQQNEVQHWKEVTMNPHITVMKWQTLRIA